MAADVVGEDDGFAGVHDLVDDEAPGFVLGGQDEDGGEVEEARKLGLVTEAAETNAFTAAGGGAALEGFALLAVADKEQVGVGIDAGSGCEGQVGFEEIDAAFAGLELGGEENDGAGGIEIELGE